MKLIIWGAAGLTLFGMAGCADDAADAAEEGPPAEAATPVRVAPAEAVELALPIQGIGTLGAKEEVALSFKVGGVISRMNVTAGSQVVEGQELASLDLSEVDAAVAQATASAQKAERDLARARTLYADSVVALAQLEDATTAAEIARAELERVSFNRRLAEIVAPSAGVILTTEAEPGELVSPGAPVLVLASRDEGAVLRVGLPDRDVVRLRRGDRAVARFDAHPDDDFQGTVTEIGASAQPGMGTFLVEISLPEAAGALSGLVGNVTISPSDAREATQIPLAALLEAEGRSGTVFVLLDDGRVERRTVTLGSLSGDRVEIASGIAPGEMVVTEGAAYLRDGGIAAVAR